MKKEKIYINLQGKTKEELTDLYWFLKNNGEKPYRDLESFLDYGNEAFEPIGFASEYFCGLGRNSVGLEEVTIQQLKQIIKHKDMTKNKELIEEAKKRGYTNDNFKCLNGFTDSGNPNLNEWHYGETEDRLYTDSFGNGGKVVYKEGVWAEIIKPVETFTPIAMKCTQEQFDAVEPKLKHLKITHIDSFATYDYLINNFSDTPFFISNISESGKRSNNRTVHEEWNEEIFLKACGIEVETLQDQLLKAEAEVKRLKEAIEDSKIKVGDWCKFWNHDKSEFIIAKFQGNKFACITSGDYFLNCEKITNPELIKLLEKELIKEITEL